MLLPPYGLCLPCSYHRTISPGIVRVGVPAAPGGGVIVDVDTGTDAQPDLVDEVMRDIDQPSLWLPVGVEIAALARHLAGRRLGGVIFLRADQSLIPTLDQILRSRRRPPRQ